MKFSNLINFIIGSCLASHAAVVSKRWGHKDFIFSRSKCDTCGFELSLLDELPIISYFLLGGRCRYCHTSIPAELVVIEVIGGFSFIKVPYNLAGLSMAAVIFSLLLAAISDYDKGEFPWAFLFPSITLALFQAIKKVPTYQALDYYELLPILLFLVYQVIHKKLGLGDLINYLLISLYFYPEFANRVFLSAAILVLLTSLTNFKNKKQVIFFVPYIFLGLIIQLLLS